MVQKKLDEKRASRISAFKKLPKVNSALAVDYMSEQESDDNTGELKIKKKKSGNVNLLQDDCFKGLFADADFQVDATSHEYKLHHPSESQSKVTARKFEPVEDDDEDDDKIRFTRFKNKEQSGPKFFELKVSYLTSLFRMDLVRPQRHPKSWKRSKVKLWILPLEYKHIQVLGLDQFLVHNQLFNV
jgi:hypothetical protein